MSSVIPITWTGEGTGSELLFETGSVRLVYPASKRIDLKLLNVSDDYMLLLNIDH